MVTLPNRRRIIQADLTRPENENCFVGAVERLEAWFKRRRNCVNLFLYRMLASTPSPRAHPLQEDELLNRLRSYPRPSALRSGPARWPIACETGAVARHCPQACLRQRSAKRGPGYALFAGKLCRAYAATAGALKTRGARSDPGIQASSPYNRTRSPRTPQWMKTRSIFDTAWLRD